MNNNKQFDLLDILSIFQTGLSVLNYQENVTQCSNNDIIKELDKQNKQYLIKIIEQNEHIISLLEGRKKCTK